MIRTLTCLLLISALLAPAGPVAAQGEGPPGETRVDLSPASWPEGELEAYTALNTSKPRRRELARGESGLVVGTTGALAVRAGLEALKQGGSAADAALVTALTQVTLAAGSWVSYAGILTMVYYDAGRFPVPPGTQPMKPVRYLNGEFATVLGEDDPLSIPANSPSGRTALVPGFMAAVEAAHDRYGRLPWSELFQPAIYFAEEGFVLDGDLASTIAFRAQVLGRLPETRSVFFKADGSLPVRGELLRQPALAATLEAVARRGADYMYAGPWGEKLVAALAAEGGKMRMEDLRRYRALWRGPRTTHYHGHALHAPGPPGAGGNLVRRAFNMLKSKDLAALGHYTESADSLYELMRATRSVYNLVPPLNHSDGVIAIDADGNAAAVLHSINTTAWGQTGIFVDGVSIPDAAAQQQRRIQTAGPGNRIWSGTNPIIVTRNRRLVAASSAIGNGLFEATAQSLVDLIDFGMTPKEAVDLGKFRSPVRSTEPLSTWPTRVTQGDFPPDLIQAVRNMGIPIRMMRPQQPDGRGYWIGASIDRATGEWTGATLNRFNGHAEGY